ncbi:hypothetical protein V8B97DRAFT_1195150 [Scleroderma yunnanense]
MHPQCHRSLSRAMATRTFKPNSAVVCWVDILLAKLGTLSTFFASDFCISLPGRALPDVLQAQQLDDSTRAAIQLPDDWDTVPSLLTSSRASPAAKRLAARLLFGSHVLFGGTLGNSVSHAHSPQSLLTALSIYIQDIEYRLLDSAVASHGHEYLVEQERLTSAMVITLFSFMSMSSQIVGAAHPQTTFRPKTITSIIRLLAFIVNNDEFTTPAGVLYPLEQLNSASSILVREGVVPLWGLSVWMEYQNPRRDTFLQLATTYLSHKGHPNAFGQILGDQISNSDDLQRAVMTAMLELLSRYSELLVSLPPTQHLSASVVAVLHSACILVRRSVDADICGIRDSVDCCKILLNLFLNMCQIEQYGTVTSLVLECLTLMRDSPVCDGWRSVHDDSGFQLQAVIERVAVGVSELLSQIFLEQSCFLLIHQLMQFLVITISKGVEIFDHQSTVSISETAGIYLLNFPFEKTTLLREVFLAYSAVVYQRHPHSGSRKSTPTFDFEVIWHMCIGTTTTENPFLASAFSAYIMSTRPLEQIWCLCAWDYLADTLLLIETCGYLSDDRRLTIILCSTICCAMLYLFRHAGDDTRNYIITSPKTMVLRVMLQHLEREFRPTSDKLFPLMRCNEISKRADISILLGLLVDNTEDHFHPDAGMKTHLEELPPMSFQVILSGNRHTLGLILIPSETVN